jgi:hypothetical protein
MDAAPPGDVATSTSRRQRDVIVLSTILLVLAIGLVIYSRRTSGPDDQVFGSPTVGSSRHTRRVIKEFHETPIKGDPDEDTE